MYAVDAVRRLMRRAGNGRDRLAQLAGLTNAYQELNREVGLLRSTAAPYVRPEEQAARMEGKPSIFVVTLPKSATVFIGNTLAQSLGYDFRHTLVTPTFPKNIVWVAMAFDFQRGGMVSASHMQADVYNLNALRYTGLKKGVLHIRDPRAALLSWVHFQTRHGQKGELSYGVGTYSDPNLTERSRRPLEEQIDSSIDGFHARCIEWLEQWVDALDNNPQFDFLILSHDELVTSEQGYFCRILDFYGIKAEIRPVAREEGTHFRSGDNNEWRRVFTPEQKRRLNEAIPDRLWQRFRWKE